MDSTNKKILVVEDDDMLRSIVISQLSAKYAVVSARDGEEALIQIEKEKPDLMVLDLMLPKLDGFGVLEKLRAMADPQVSKTPVFVVSNLNTPESMAKALGYGIEAYFLKMDVSLGTLSHRIDRFFNPVPEIK